MQGNGAFRRLSEGGPSTSTVSLEGSTAKQGRFQGLRARRKSRLWTYCGILGGWVITWTIVAAMYFMLYFYSEVMQIMSSTTKKQFNAVITGLSIALSIMVVKSLNDFVSTLRWWILSRRHHSLRKVDLILQAESASRVLMLATKTRRFPVHAAAGVWLCTIIAAQIGMALLGLCYSVEDQDALALVVTEGKVSVPDMSSIQTAKIVNGPSSPEAEEYTANNYGQISLAYTTGTPDDHPEIGTIWTPSSPLMFCGVDYCDYIFHEESVDSSVDNGNGGEDQDEDSTPPKTLVVTTDRNIVSTATCHSWRVVKGASGNETIITIDTTADDITNRDKNVTIPVRGGVNQTTYMTDNSENCGAGCRLVNAFEVSDAAAWYYSCNVTVSRVANGTIPEHEVSESLRSMAAASIALQGSAVLSLDNDNIQYQIYPSESIFGLPNLGQNNSMAMVMARFAIGTVAVAAHANDPIVVNGFAPVEGSHVVIDHWDYAILILNSVVFAQFVLGVATAVVASRVVIPEGGPIAMAQVLRAIADRVQGCHGDDAMSSGGEGGVWIYKAVKTAEKGTYDLYMEERPCGPNNTHSMELS